MTEDTRKVADYFVICGLPPPEKQHQLDEYSLEVNLKPSHNQDPITDITVIFPGLGENVPDYYQLIDMTPTGLPADLNHGSFRAPEVFICFRRGRDRPPLIDLGVLCDVRDKISPGTQLVEFTPHGHIANVNNSTNSSTFLTYRRADCLNPCNEFVVMDISIIIGSKGETPPHTFIKIDKSLNKGMVGSDVYLCFKKSMNRADLISYKPGLLDRYPMTNNPTFTLDDTVALFCLPMGANLECWPLNTTSTTTTKSTFVLTLQNTEKVYGSAISFYEEYEEDLLSEEQSKLLKLDKYKSNSDRKIMTNKCICLLSQWPFFEAFEKFLFFIYKRLLMGPFDIPIERLISHFLYSVPFPSPDRPRILVQLSSLDNIALYQPQELPLPRSGANFRLLLTTLGPDNCQLLLLMALTEQKILVHSLHPDVVTAVCEAIMQIIFPFYWQCPYIPLCPIGMCDYLSAPLPFVMGLDSRFFDLYDQPNDVNAVDLDTNTISLCPSLKQLTTKLLPKKAARNLKNSLTILQDKCLQHNRLAQKLEMENDDSIDFEFKLRARENALELEIQEAFLLFMAGILGGYRLNLLPITRAPTAGVTDVGNLFDINAFLRSRDRNFHLFYKLVMKTQMFTKFIEECSFVSDINTSLAFFDECVERVEREEGGRLLDNEGAVSDRTVFILPPDPSDLPEGKEYKNSSLEKFDHSLFKDNPDLENDEIPNPAEKLITPASALAKRTKQEIRSSVKIARKHVDSPLLWAKCLLATTYSIWFIHLPSMVLHGKGSISTQRSGYNLLERMQRLRLHPVDEICYRVMMQLCGLYSQPVLAVKVLFEMRRCGVHPNAVTYGYYNKAVLESEWPHGIASSSQLLWHKLRNVLTAVWLFKQAGKTKRIKEEDAVSQVSLESGMSHNEEHEADGTGSKDSDLDKNGSKESGIEEKPEESTETDCRNSSGSHSDVGYASMNEHAGVLENNDADSERKISCESNSSGKTLERTRSYSIVKPPVTRKISGDDECDAFDETDETIVASDQPDRTSIQNIWDDDVDPKENSDEKVKVVRYTDIRNKFPNLLNKDKSSGPARTLFRQESSESQYLEQVRGFIEGSPGSRTNSECISSRGGSENRDYSETSVKSGSSESLEILESLPESPEKSVKDNRLPTLEEVTPVESEQPDLLKPLGSLTLEDRSNSRANLEKIPVTMDDPLGALSSQNSPMVTPAKDKVVTLPSGEMLSQRSMSMSDVLGEPFSTPVSSKSVGQMFPRSSTMPLNGDGDESPRGSTPSLVGSISSITSSGMKSITGSKAANIGIKRGKALLSTAWTSLSPQTSKNTKEALYKLGSWSSSAANNLSKKYEEMRESVTQSPAQLEQTEEDRVSQSSTDSRRQSETVQPEIPQDTWSTLTDALWNHLWGDNAKSHPTTNQTQRAADITEQFETLYARAKAESEESQKPVAMTIMMTSCSRCRLCGSVLFDEEIMAGWTAEDSNLNTCCAFCERLTVPTLTTMVTDYRASPPVSTNPTTNCDNTPTASNEIPHPLESRPPLKHKPITVPYISPLVLRRELESILEKEGDACLTNAACPDLHPIIYWNLIYYFHRIAVPSHLPGMVLQAPSLNKDNGATKQPGWEDADYKNVRVHTRWDNDSLYKEDLVPLHIQWRKRNCASDLRVMHPLMQAVIKGVKENDLKYCVESIIRERVRRDDSTGPRVLDPNNLLSVYRESLFLTLVSLGQDNIDLTAFDREYRRAFEKLRMKELSSTVACDRPPQMGTLFCRKLFRDLTI
jgi:pentatricopeptide repeat protein